MDKIHPVFWIIAGMALTEGFLRASLTMQPLSVILIAMGFVYCFALGGTVGRRLLINQLNPREES